MYTTPTLEPQSIAHYRITGKLGEGGMGAVYRATDGKLNRDVAIKVLPDTYAQDGDRLSRFTREAQVLASLNHPNIAMIFGIEERAIVMELVEGPTLADRIAQGAIPLEEALGIARQIAEALETAHERNVVHRDLKPANVKVTPEGTVKVLDFGLAKLADPREATEPPQSAPTVVRGHSPTMAGMIMGTAEYMSPEQASGKPVDKRTDIWAFGVVLWEMLSGNRMFAGETVSHTLADVLRAPIEFHQLPGSVPRPIRELLRRCLERDVKIRLRDIGEARIAIQQYLANPNGAVVVDAVGGAAKPGRRSVLPWVLAATLVPASVGAGWMLRRIPAAPVLRGKFVLLPPEPVEFTSTGHSVSPDGRHLILRGFDRGQRGESSLYLRGLEETTYRALPDTAGAAAVAWSPDSKSIVFGQLGKWRRMEIAGGVPQTLCDAPETQAGASWNEQGTILLQIGNVIHRIPAAGGTPTPVTTLDAKNERYHAYPHFLPGGRFFLYTAWSGGAAAGRGTTWIGDLEGKEAPKKLLESETAEVKFAGYAGMDTGLLLFRRNSGLAGVPFDVRRRVLTGDPFPLVERIPSAANRSLAVGVSQPARVMVYSPSRVADSEELSLIDRQGKKVSTLAPPNEGTFGHLEFSPDGKTLMGSRLGKDGTRDLWAVDLGRGAVSRITFSGGSDKAQGWAPDGRRIFYMSMGNESPGIWVTPADGTGKPELLLKTTGHHIGVSPDGRYVAFEKRDGERQSIGLLDVTKPGTFEELITGNASYNWPQFSPDGRWLAYISNETGRQEVYVQSFPVGRGKWQVTRNGGRLARWRRDGKELVIAEGNGLTAFHSVGVRKKGDGLEFDTPAKLFEISMVGRAGSNYFALSPDGQRIALNLTPNTVGTQLMVMLDWMPAIQ
ncbi:MAG: protein kinase [Acidobacteria bacterium]|nr:protein kinase [Acidobacteriota bacterium]